MSDGSSVMNGTRIVITSNLFPALAIKAPIAVGKIVKATAYKLRTYALDSMSQPKHGRAYRRGAISKSYSLKGGRWRKWAGSGLQATASGGKVSVITGYKFHRASAPYEAPAVDTGNLKNQIAVEMNGKTSAKVIVSAEYGPHLEYGTRKMRRRPFLRPAADKVRTGFIQDLMNLEASLK
jgi:HK97 gp10 family phage protein